MLEWNNFLLFTGTTAILAVTPGPNILYLVSRSLCQGRTAGLISLIGVIGGFVAHMVATILGLSAIFLAAPWAYYGLKWAGALYLLWLAWQSLRPGAVSPFQARNLPSASARKLLLMGFLTSLLNPKIAFFYLSLFPQFIAPEQGSIAMQTLILGATQITISCAVNIMLILSAARLSAWLIRYPGWLKTQRYVMGCVLGFLGVRLAAAR